MIRLLWRTDIHVSEKNPASRKDDYFQTCMAKIRYVGFLAKKYKVDAVIDGGDFFHHKSSSLTSHKGLIRIIEAHNGYPCPVYCNVGNHDCAFGKIEYLDDVQPLGVLFSSGVFRRLYNEHELVLEKNGVKVRCVGIPYHGVSYDKERFSKIRKEDEDFLYVNAHLLASKKGGSMFGQEDILSYREIFELCPDMDICSFGHWHKDQGITEFSKNKTVINVGSLTRGSLSEDHITRKPCVVLMEFSEDGYRTERLNLPVKPSEEIFTVEKKNFQKELDKSIEEFSEKISSQDFSSKEVDFYDLVKKYSLDKRIEEKAILYYERAKR